MERLREWARELEGRLRLGGNLGFGVKSFLFGLVRFLSSTAYAQVEHAPAMPHQYSFVDSSHLVAWLGCGLGWLMAWGWQLDWDLNRSG